MTLPRLYAMYDHWRQWPPVHVSLALFAGIKPQEDKSDKEQASFIESMPAMTIRRPK